MEPVNFKKNQIDLLRKSRYKRELRKNHQLHEAFNRWKTLELFVTTKAIFKTTSKFTQLVDTFL